ncbi:MAG: hypothetical protein COX62_07890 [Deltaproteobacteria bacterium CG_4_10_14_0_2_um_filter_43_8]|nr:MAG: hypothetical protein COV43_05315 [Deltaproteobacteria bacterium CG11_big_fil_rev_8_21_14_0_20_42_23]PJA18871.1 MAG: hypothetical protein COX62_07890 [Deltaproteobacteria bacterium CG_4_10_14_0_2_um_filter_43_8]PJC64011.1 MAG: hypothetical protein CO021_06290 [Deltaproteobacteria bacterium CG_4_9_14_0_2_um_filter_42_21]
MRQKFFHFLSKLIEKKSLFIIIAATFFSCASIFFASTHIRMNSDYDDLVSEDLPYHKRYKDFLKEFGDQEYLFVVVEKGEDSKRAKAFIDALAKRLKNEATLEEVLWKIDQPKLKTSFPLYLSPSALDATKDFVQSHQAFTHSLLSIHHLASLFSVVNQSFNQVQPSAEHEPVFEKGFQFLNALLKDLSSVLRGEERKAISLEETLMELDPEFDSDAYLRSGELYFLFLMPKKDFGTMEVIAEPLQKIREHLTEVKKEFPEVKAGLTGRPVLAADELAATNKDMTLATTLALLCVGFLFVFFFRSVSRPALAMLTLVMGISWTFAFVALVFGELTILSIVFALILIGAAVEYAIHFVARYQEEIQKHNSLADAVEQTLQTAGRSNMTSALTTAAAFFTFTWTDFTGLAELGVIAGVGIVLCLLAMTLVLPALLYTKDKTLSQEQRRHTFPFQVPALLGLYRYPNRVLLGFVLFLFMLSPFFARVSFDNNLLHLQPDGLESVEMEHLIQEKSSERSWFANVRVDTLEEMQSQIAQLKQLPVVDHVESITKLVPDEQEKKQQIIADIRSKLGNISFPQLSSSVQKNELLHQLDLFQKKILSLQDAAFSSGKIEEVNELEHFSSNITEFSALLQQADEATLKALQAYQSDLLGPLRTAMLLVVQALSPEKLAVSDFPEAITRRYISSKGAYTFYIYPKENIWDPDALDAFVTAVSAVNPNAFGTPYEVHESGKLMRTTFLYSAIFAFAVILFLVWFDFKAIIPTCLAIVPLMVGMFLLVCVMGLLSLSFNMANFFAIPILIGVGVDSGVHLVHRILHERNLSALGTATAKGVLLTVFANAIGFGMMMIASHKGLASLGKVMAIGSITCLLSAVVFMPPLAALLLKLPALDKSARGS